VYEREVDVPAERAGRAGRRIVLQVGAAESVPHVPGDGDPGADTWFYSNPVFVEVFRD
jgi:hypothetical protein